jgi:hypothetical protein
MIYNKHDSASYEKEFKKRFTNFAEKAPILISFNTTPTCVQVIDESKDTVYEFPWDYTLIVKDFIHAIKEVLVKACYPIIVKTEPKEEPISIAEQTRMIEKGIPLDKVPTKRIVKSQKSYLIDKVIVYRDIFLLKELDTETVWRYKLNKSSIFFLKKIRNGAFSPEEAGNFFFDKAELLNEVVGEQTEAR